MRLVAPDATVGACIHATINERSRLRHLRSQCLRGRWMDQEGPEAQQLRSDLIANVSHDLRMPLVAMRGYLELLATRGEQLGADERRRCVAVALRQCEHLGRLVDELFELARLDGLELALAR